RRAALAGKAVDDVDDVLRRAAIGVADRQRPAVRNEVDLARAVVAALHPRLEPDRRVRELFPLAALLGRTGGGVGGEERAGGEKEEREQQQTLHGRQCTESIQKSTRSRCGPMTPIRNPRARPSSE